MHVRWTPHPVIVTIRNAKAYIRVVLYSYYTTIKGWEGGPPDVYAPKAQRVTYSATKHFKSLDRSLFQCRPPITKPPPLIGDYTRNPSIQALKRRGVMNHASTVMYLLGVWTLNPKPQIVSLHFLFHEPYVTSMIPV